MAQIVLNVPDAVEARVAAAFVGVFGLPQGTQDTPANRRAFVKARVGDFVRDVVRTWESSQAASAAAGAADQAVTVT